MKVLGGVLVPKSIQKSIKKSIELLMDFWIDFGWILGGFWDHFGIQNGIKKSMKFWMRFWMPKNGSPAFLGVRPAECAGSLGGIIGGYKDAKIAGETRTRALGILELCPARRPWWGGGSLRAFRRAALCGKVGVLNCWLTGP